MMSPDLMNLALLLSLYVWLAVAVSEDVLVVTAVSGGDCVLRCTAEDKLGVQYRALTWYKVGENPPSRRSGLLTRELPNGTTRWYAGLEREVELQGESRSIFLPNLTCSDGGMYMCRLAAPVGEQNRDGQVLLTLTDCRVDPTEIVMTDGRFSLVILATAVLMLALVIFLISYSCLKNSLGERNKTTKKETLLDATLKPLDKKDLMLIYTLGPKTSTMKHICV